MNFHEFQIQLNFLSETLLCWQFLSNLTALSRCRRNESASAWRSDATDATLRRRFGYPGSPLSLFASPSSYTSLALSHPTFCTNKLPFTSLSPVTPPHRSLDFAKATCFSASTSSTAWSRFPEPSQTWGNFNVKHRLVLFFAFLRHLLKDSRKQRKTPQPNIDTTCWTKPITLNGIQWVASSCVLRKHSISFKWHRLPPKKHT